MNLLINGVRVRVAPRFNLVDLVEAMERAEADRIESAHPAPCFAPVREAVW